MTRRLRDSIRCPDCKSARFMVIWSRSNPDGSVARVRECLTCGSKWRVTCPPEIILSRTAKTYKAE